MNEDIRIADLLRPSRSLAGFGPQHQDGSGGEELHEGDGSDSYVYFRIDPRNTNYVNRIIESYEYVGVMTTVSSDGLCIIRCTPDTRQLAIDILSDLKDIVVLEK